LEALEFAGVSKRFGERYALRGVSFSLPAGSALGLLGPNGAGKTTALRILLGFTAASEGSVRVRGLLPEDSASRIGVAYLPERLMLPARMSVRRFLHLHGTLAGLARDEIEREVEAALELTGIADRAGDRIGA
jgi:ABC-2 type transport system ATP-binding protein